MEAEANTCEKQSKDMEKAMNSYILKLAKKNGIDPMITIQDVDQSDVESDESIIELLKSQINDLENMNKIEAG